MQTYDILKEKVSIYDLFDIADPRTTYLTKAKPCQISCPFHGKDAHPSARVYPDTNTLRCFTCSKSWNVVTYWAQINKWFTESDALDIGRAIQDLCLRFNISDNSFDWEKRFYSLRRDIHDSNKEVTFEERHKLAAYYAWNISKSVHKVDGEDRKARKIEILGVWDEFDAISLTSETWQGDLINWYQSAKVKLHDKKI